MPEEELTAVQREKLIRKKLDSGVIQIRSKNRWVMYDISALEKALARTQSEIARDGGRKPTRQIKITSVKDL